MRKSILLANRGETLDHGMRAYLCASSNFNVWANYREWPNHHITSELCLTIDYSGCMNQSHYAPFVRTAQVMSASAANSPSTVAVT